MLDPVTILRAVTTIVHRFGEGRKVDVEATWCFYEDAVIKVVDGWPWDDFLHVTAQQEEKIVLEWYRRFKLGIRDKESFFKAWIEPRAYALFKARPVPHSSFDDWLDAERELLPWLEARYAGAWEFASVDEPVAGAGGCVVLMRGDWIDHVMTGRARLSPQSPRSPVP